jgi:phosphopantothenoylcysteine decarboxylase/phosphopantothenate--cysteine ligase
MGADVTVIRGLSEAPIPEGITVVPVSTALEMQTALSARFADTDICIMAAAVADFRPQTVSAEKLVRKDTAPTLSLVANPDICAALGASKTNQCLIGFSLETQGGIDRARIKMEAKKCDIMVYNQPGTSLGTDTAEVTILTDDGNNETLPSLSKRDVAQKILAAAIPFLTKPGQA